MNYIYVVAILTMYYSPHM